MKINNDAISPGLKSDKNESTGRVSKNVKSETDQTVQAFQTSDEVELTNKKMPAVNQMRETEIANTAAVEFDVSEVPMMKQRMQFINNYILNNPADALAAQARLNPGVVAGLIG